MKETLIIAGFGGQGVLSMGKILAYSGVMQDFEVTWMPSYGPEMRGGTANCSVTLSDEPIGSPLVTEPPIAVLMNKPSLKKFEPTMEKGGLLLYNSSLIDEAPTRDDVTVVAVPCNDIAEQLGNPKACRAVGMANNRNPVAVIIPCHRVLGKDGKLVGYAGGLSVKQGLLALEQKYR